MLDYQAGGKFNPGEWQDYFCLTVWFRSQARPHNIKNIIFTMFWESSEKDKRAPDNFRMFWESSEEGQVMRMAIGHIPLLCRGLQFVKE